MQFQIADLLFHKDEMSTSNLNELFTLLGLNPPPPATSDSEDSASDMGINPKASAPFKDHDDMYNTIDALKLGDTPWQCLKVNPCGTAEEPLWKQKIYKVWFRDPDIVLQNMLDNPDFDGKFDYSPYVEVDDKNNRRWGDAMSANYAWRHAVSLGPSVFDELLIVPFLRQRSITKTLSKMSTPCTVLLSLEVTRPRYLLLLDKLSTIHCTSLLGTFGAALVARTVKELYQLPF